MTHQYSVSPIAYVRSPFKDKFGIPRQPGLITAANAQLEFIAPYDNPDAFEGLDAFSHLWLSFIFHLNDYQHWRPKVRPPRLGGNTKLGVFATRSSFHPNGLGLSCVKLNEIIIEQGKVKLGISCPDLVDGTPILDIKPYVSYADAIENAESGFAPESPSASLSVDFTDKGLNILAKHESKLPKLKKLISEVLSFDPRPAYKQNHDDRVYGIRLYDLDIKWQVKGNVALVLDIVNVT